ncbi:hypothetical protein [Rhodococcus sp. NPDC058521]
MSDTALDKSLREAIDLTNEKFAAIRNFFYAILGLEKSRNV